MKREAFSHPKLLLVSKDLKLPMCYVRGILESLWTVTAMNFPQGDIGRWSNEELGVSIEYPGDADELIASLTKRRLLDQHDSHRLVVHHWSDHADDAVHMRLARHGLRFADGKMPNLTRLSKEQREKALARYTESASCAHDEHINSHRGALPEPEPEPEPEPTTKPEVVSILRPVIHTHTVPQKSACASDLSGQVSSRWEEFWAKYPRKQRKDLACHEFISVVTTENESQVFACLDRYLASDEVERRVVMNPDNWLYEQHRNGWSGDWPKPKPKMNGSNGTSAPYKPPPDFRKLAAAEREQRRKEQGYAN